MDAKHAFSIPLVGAADYHASKTSLLRGTTRTVKGFQQQVDGPMGPWYQKVNAAVRRAKDARTVEELRDILGEPDHIEIVHNEWRESEDAPVDERYLSQAWEYVDPYRPRFHYTFDISLGRVVGTSRLTYDA